ncbi:hypothetical protein mvi_01710 [Methylobacterium indicum]|uniref:Uncharacterized protein n=2 Tax=Methylobacterium indicum TaxID=1775910 RepID=A0A8H9C3Z3_9HYPH|nr:hypothetical protein mvi_01710 [Methylobacterium indicum]
MASIPRPRRIDKDDRQRSLWDVLGEEPEEMKAPPRPVILSVSTPEPPEPPLPPLTAEDLAAIEHLSKSYASLHDPAFTDAHDDLWNASITKGAVPSVVEVPAWPGRKPRDNARVILTRTRLGYTAGHEIWIETNGRGRSYGSGDGGYLRPATDLQGYFFWTTRQAAIQAGATQLWLECQDEALAAHVRGHFAAQGVDVSQAPGEEWKLRLFSHDQIRRIAAAGPSAEDLALVELGPTADLLAYERAIGLSDVDHVLDAPARAPAPAPEVPGVEKVLLAHYEGVIDPPSPVTLKRRQKKQEREEAAAAAWHEPTFQDCADVHAAIGAILPPGVPTYADAIVAVSRPGGRILADIRLWDGAVGRVEISGEPGAHGYRWETTGVEGTAFHWDARARAWERIPEEA